MKHLGGKKFHEMSIFYGLQEKQQQSLYIELLKTIASFSNLFSDSSSPYLYYRTHENIFAYSFNAKNLARRDISIDAQKEQMGIGLKTFLQGNGKTYQKIAEFDKNMKLLDKTDELSIVRTISKYRNSIILFAKNLYALNTLLYHVVTRDEGRFMVFEEVMEEIDIENIKIEKCKKHSSSILFSDEKNEYNFNFSKSTLLKRFICPPLKAIESCNVGMIKKPLQVLLEIYRRKDNILLNSKETSPCDYIILPLYSAKHKQVEKSSGLNQWNAKGRRRDENEVYIPIPSWIHKIKGNFFNYNTKDYKTSPFEVILPDGKVLSMKVCQAGGKALMSNPNNLLGKWILRDILNLPVGTLVTRELLDMIGIDSIKLIKIDYNKYEMQFLRTGRFEIFEKLYKKR